MRVEFGKSKDKVLAAHWQADELKKVGAFFESTMKHSQAFFLLAVEDCRESVMRADEFEQDNIRGNDGNRLLAKNGWVDCEMTGVVNESESRGTAPKDPRLGSVWVVSAMLQGSVETDNNDYGGRGVFQKNRHSGFTGGDLMVLHSRFL